MLNILEKLCTLNGPSGWEDDVRAYIEECAKPYAEECFTDSIGNLFVLKRGAERRSRPVMVCAHMDEVGIIIKSITDEGYLKFCFVGGVDRRVVIGKRVLVGGKYPGLIGIKAVHLSTKDERKSVPKLDDLYIDIGATSKAQAEKLVSLGDYAVFDSPYYPFGEGFVKARALDDRVGCAVMLSLLTEDLPYDTWFVFTVQEECGIRGAAVAAHRIMPESALVLEGTTAADLPGNEGITSVCHVGAGPVIGFIDGMTIYNKEYFSRLCQLADENNIPWQIKSLIAGGTDAGAVHKTGDGVRTALLAAPLRYIHSPACVGAFSDIENMKKLAYLFLSDLKGE